MGTSPGAISRLLSACVLVWLCAGCRFPRDPSHTAERVLGGTMRVGVVENPPWVCRSPGAASADPAGVEVDLAREFARRRNARIAWVWGTENSHMQALEHDNLDLVIAGLTEKTPWDGRVGLTRPYYTEDLIVGVPASVPALPDLSGQRVAVESGAPAVYLLQKKHAVPVQITDLRDRPLPPPNLPVAAPRWQIERWGLVPTRIELNQESHVLAVPPGENCWLMQWETFLQSQRSQVVMALTGRSPS